MKFYETGLILDPQLDDAGFDGEIKKVTDIIESNSGTIEKVDRWGIRRLAYQIKKKSQGFYTFIYYNAPSEVPRLIETMLRIKITLANTFIEFPNMYQTQITFSAGVTEIKKTDKTFDDIYRRADNALLSAKDKGRNKIEIA